MTDSDSSNRACDFKMPSSEDFFINLPDDQYYPLPSDWLFGRIHFSPAQEPILKKFTTEFLQNYPFLFTKDTLEFAIPEKIKTNALNFLAQANPQEKVEITFGSGSNRKVSQLKQPTPQGSAAFCITTV
ncbi:MAG: hypothetical protein BroJett040_25170 [Oligoflexia bacterium]|nr:MAG: hypothetical protein BroJett040_25170 [Oligoflexia bacterium]